MSIAVSRACRGVQNVLSVDGRRTSEARIFPSTMVGTFSLVSPEGESSSCFQVLRMGIQSIRRTVCAASFRRMGFSNGPRHCVSSGSPPGFSPGRSLVSTLPVGLLHTPFRLNGLLVPSSQPGLSTSLFRRLPRLVLVSVFFRSARGLQG